MIGFLIVLVILLVSRAMNEKALKNLTQEKKAELIDLFSKDRIYNLLALIFIIALFFANTKLNLIDSTLSFTIYMILLFAFMIITGFLAFKKLKANNYPDSYIRSFILTSSIRFVGLIVFFMLLLYN